MRELVTPAPMEGHGVYNHDSQVQAAGLSPGLPFFEQAAEKAVIDSNDEPIVIVDYGASEGRNSLLPIATAIRTLRTRGTAERAISVVHADLPQSDFSTLFETLATDPNSYLRMYSNVYASAVGRSFYDQIVPSQSVTLGWTSWAIQWLSRLPASIPDQLQVAYSQDIAIRTLFKQQAADDWRVFLKCRGRELRPGGQLVVVTMALDEHGSFGYEAVLAAMYAALKDLVADGFVRADEAHRMAIPTVGRSRADFLEPFGSTGSFAGLSIAAIDIFAGEDRIWSDFRQDGDAQRFGARWAAFSRASVFPTLAAALDGGADDPRATAFVERMEADMAARLAMTPAATTIPLARLRIAKACD